MPHALEFLTEGLPSFVVGAPQNFKIQVGGGSAPYTFKITSGTLPVALKLSKNGTISGAVKRMVTGRTIFVTLTDAKGTKLTQAFDVQIIPNGKLQPQATCA